MKVRLARPSVEPGSTGAQSERKSLKRKASIKSKSSRGGMAKRSSLSVSKDKESKAIKKQHFDYKIDVPGFHTMATLNRQKKKKKTTFLKDHSSNIFSLIKNTTKPEQKPPNKKPIQHQTSIIPTSRQSSVAQHPLFNKEEIKSKINSVTAFNNSSPLSRKGTRRFNKVFFCLNEEYALRTPGRNWASEAVASEIPE